MRRGTPVLRDRELEGSERSYQLANTLAGIASPELLEQLIFAVSKLHDIGGQTFIAAVRSKYAKHTVRNPRGEILGEHLELLADPREPGQYETDAYVFHWDHIATAIRGAEREPDTDFPVDVARDLKQNELQLSEEQAAELEAERELAGAAQE